MIISLIKSCSWIKWDDLGLERNTRRSHKLTENQHGLRSHLFIIYYLFLNKKGG